jgi:hypothetical protein
MELRSTRSCALRMAILICLVAAIDVAASLLIAKPQVWCALIPILIPIFTPVAIYTRRIQPENGTLNTSDGAQP